MNRRGVIDSGSPNGARPSKMRRLRPKRRPAWAISKLLLLKKTLAARVLGQVVTNVSRRRLALPRKFCSSVCRNALRRVLRRERFWRVVLSRIQPSAPRALDSS